MVSRDKVSALVFKTAWFSRAALKAHIADDELCAAIQQAMLGLADDLGGGVFKKRLDKNRYRSIILARGGDYWVFEYLFAKKDRANIDAGELVKFRQLAKVYEAVTEKMVARLVQQQLWLEICDGE